MSRKRTEDIGTFAVRARVIAEHVARHLGTAIPYGPEGRRIIVEAALTCPMVRTQRQAEAVADGYDGQGSEHRPGHGCESLRICRSAGRQLAAMSGMFLGAAS